MTNKKGKQVEKKTGRPRMKYDEPYETLHLTVPTRILDIWRNRSMQTFVPVRMVATQDLMALYPKTGAK